MRQCLQDTTRASIKSIFPINGLSSDKPDISDKTYSDALPTVSAPGECTSPGRTTNRPVSGVVMCIHQGHQLPKEEVQPT
ncbi:hypothetical protein HMPREF9997_01793 [Corynebacterium durum F0235]|uniref:Uncharacterized protein n=1 Tax=Corynebacterium durum F0235 TaxID=1035195 RepID=L1MF02_9CORY|nr:hypothetical protein HMPREF9997_01793 [Corynebacterium durum F0235]